MNFVMTEVVALEKQHKKQQCSSIWNILEKQSCGGISGEKQG